MPSEIECEPVPEAPGCALLWWPFLLRSRGLLSALASSIVTRTEEMKAMRLTLNEHHRKLRAPIRDISDWLVNANASDFCRPPPRLPVASHHYLLPPTTPEER